MRSVSIAIAASFTLSLCHAGNLVGIAVDPNSPNPLTPYWGLPYLIDPITGATTLITQNFTWYDNGPRRIAHRHAGRRVDPDCTWHRERLRSIYPQPPLRQGTL